MSSELFNVADIFGEDVFNDTVMQQRLPKKVYKKLKETIEEGKELDLATADVIAHEMKEWAIEKGATGTSRWGAPDVANGPAIKLIFNFGGNCVVNQAGDYNLTTQILKMPNAQTVSEDANFPNRKYQLELLVTSDFFMTSSAQFLQQWLLNATSTKQ